MRAYICQHPTGEWLNSSCFAAAEGFCSFGWEVVPFQANHPPPSEDPTAVVVGGLGHVESALRALGCAVPAADDYPTALHPFLGRRLWSSTLNAVAADPAQWPVFVKPQRARKQFTGVLVRRLGDLIGCGRDGEDLPIWCAEPVAFVAEWRCFVRYGQVVGVQPYRGDWRAQFSAAVVEAMVGAYQGAPRAYAFDIGVTTQGQTLLVEVNEGYAVGSYGLRPLLYAKCLSARWAELTSTEDECNF